MSAGVSTETYTVASDVLSRVALSAQKKYVKDKLPKVGWGSLHLLSLLESIKQQHGISGDDGAINDGMQLVPELLAQYIRGEDTIMNPQVVNDSLRFESIYTHVVMPIKFPHDEWRQRGWEFVPHASGSFESRVKQMGEERLQRLSSDLIRYTMDGVNQRYNEVLEQSYIKAGASYKEPIGINGQFPIAPIGSIYGHNRANQPVLRHYVRGSTIGSGGTMMADLRKQSAILNEAVANSGLSGEWVPFAGIDWIEGYASELERMGIQRNADASGVTKADGILQYDALRVGGIKPMWLPMLDKMDSLFPSEIGLTPSTDAVTFSGGGASRQATGFALVSAAGAITDIVITDPGEGYTSAPTVDVATGTGETLQAKIFSTSSGAAYQTVAADDYRIGRLASVTVSVGGTGFTPGQAVPFRKRCFFLFKPAMVYKIGNGVDRRIVLPADPARVRTTELQMDTLSYFYNRLPAAFALNYISN